MGLSVIALIPVYNSGKFIKKSLDLVLEQSYPVKEVYVIDDGGKDNTVEITEKIAKSSKKIKVHILKRPHTGMRGNMLNDVIKTISCDLIWIVEADAYHDKDFLKKSVKDFSDPKVGGVIGKEYPMDVKTFLDRCRLIEFDYKYKNYKPYTAWVIRKKALEKSGGFSENTWLFDDVLLGNDLKKAGYKIVFEPESKRYHFQKTSIKALLRQRYFWGYAFYLTLKNKGYLPKYIPFWTAVFAGLPLVVAYNPTLTLSAIVSVLLLLFLNAGSKMRKQTKNPAIIISIVLVRLFRQIITTIYFWIGLILRAAGKNIL